MSDTTLSYLLVGLGIVFTLVLVLTATTRDGRSDRRGAGAADRPAHPPAGVHLPPPSWLPVIIAVAAALLAAGVIFTPWALVPGLVVLLIGAFGWYRAAGHEWHSTDQGDHDDARAH